MDLIPYSLYQAKQVRQLDQIAIGAVGIPGFALMQRAAKASFDHALAHFPAAKHLTIFCGHGNNGGDGFVFAGLAVEAGFSVSLWQVGDERRLSGDALLAYQHLRQLGQFAKKYEGQDLGQTDLIIDAMLGTGLSGLVGSNWKVAIEAINNNQSPVLSLDIPSGLCSDTGRILGCAIVADVTVTFVGVKRGLLTMNGRDCCGQLYFNNLGLADDVYDRIRSDNFRVDYDKIKSRFLKRSANSHKGSFGHVILVGGDHGKTGAIRLSGLAAARVGSGLVSLAVRHALRDLINLSHPEFMTIDAEADDFLRNINDERCVLGLGPGLGLSPWARHVFDNLDRAEKNIVVDADALNLLAESPCVCQNWILTPHPGEAARLLQCDVNEVQKDRFAAVHDIQKRYGGVCVLKGCGTLIKGSKPAIYLCSDGNPGMSCGGMGDVLTGVICGLLAQGFSLLDAAILGVCLHARAGDRVAVNGQRGLIPSDLMIHLRSLVNLKSGES